MIVNEHPKFSSAFPESFRAIQQNTLNSFCGCSSDLLEIWDEISEEINHALLMTFDDDLEKIPGLRAALNIISQYLGI